MTSSRRRRRRRWPWIVAVVVVVLAALLVAGDIVARVAVQNAVATRVRNGTGAKSASVRISSFPFLYEAWQGRVGAVSVTETGVPAGVVTLDRVSLRASGVRFDRNELVDHRHVRFTAVARATVTVDTTLTGVVGTVANLLGVDVSGTSKDLTITVDGRQVAHLDLTNVALIPSCPLSVSRTGPSFSLSCTVAPVPASVLAALSDLPQK